MKGYAHSLHELYTVPSRSLIKCSLEPRPLPGALGHGRDARTPAAYSRVLL
jgi:hypothetical protein